LENYNFTGPGKKGLTKYIYFFNIPVKIGLLGLKKKSNKKIHNFFNIPIKINPKMYIKTIGKNKLN
jgi:hypothetical protein